MAKKQRRRSSQQQQPSSKLSSSSSSSSSSTKETKEAATTASTNVSSNSTSALSSRFINASKEVKQEEAKESILKKLYDPATLKRYESIHYQHNQDINNDNNTNHDGDDQGGISLRLNPMEAMELSYIPWKIQIIREQQSKNHQQTYRTANSTKTNAYDDEYYPNWNYLAIRHKQNLNLVQSLFEKGVSFAKLGLQKQKESSYYQQQQQNLPHIQSSSSSTTISTLSSYHELLQNAENCYKQGLDLIPSHIGILTAYSALCINDNRLQKAQYMLLDVLERESSYLPCTDDEKNTKKNDNDSNDNNNKKTNFEIDYGGKNVIQDIYKDAKLYMTVVEQKLLQEQEKREKDQQQQRKYQVSSTSITRQKTTQLHLSNKVNDLMAERSFITKNDINISNGNTNGKTSSQKQVKQYELLPPSPSTTEDADDDSSSFSSSNSSCSDDDKRRRRKRRKSQRRKSSSSRRHKSYKKERKSSKPNDETVMKKDGNHQNRRAKNNNDEDNQAATAIDDNNSIDKDKRKKRKKRKRKKESDKDRRKRKKHRRRRSIYEEQSFSSSSSIEVQSPNHD